MTNADFISYVCSFDFICLVETFVKDFNSTVFRDYTCFCLPAIKFMMQGRRSSILLCLIKKEFMSYVKTFNVVAHDFGAVLIDKTLFTSDKDVLYVYCYVPPEGSPYYAYFDSDNGIAVLEEFITDCLLARGDVYVLLCGDLNSRTSVVSHHCCRNNSSILDFEHTSHPISVHRHSEDSTLNSYGKLLLNVCTALDMCIVNGMCEGDLQGRYTYVSDSGCSVNDYFVMSCELFSFLCESCELNVDERIESDHLPVEFHFNPTHDSPVNTLNQNFPMEKLVWNETYADMYNNNIRSKEFQEQMNNAVRLIEVDVNEALTAFNTCIKSAAGCMIKHINQHKTHKSQDWFGW